MKNYQMLALGLIAGAALALSTAAACAPDTEPEEGVGEASYLESPECLFGGNQMYMIDKTCEDIPADWEFTTGETLVCGTGAKPALDYREDVGWWAYCEPALVD